MLKEKQKDYWLLSAVNHTNKEFHLRVEDKPGVGKHSLSNYCGDAGDKRNDTSTPDWVKKRYQWMYDNRRSVEQAVILRTEASSPQEAREFFKHIRQDIAKSFERAGYTKAC